jgi:hypothetical protein
MTTVSISGKSLCVCSSELLIAEITEKIHAEIAEPFDWKFQRPSAHFFQRPSALLHLKICFEHGDSKYLRQKACAYVERAFNRRDYREDSRRNRGAVRLEISASLSAHFSASLSAFAFKNLFRAWRQ